MSLFHFLLQFAFLLIVGGAAVFMALLGAFWLYDVWTDR